MLKEDHELNEVSGDGRSKTDYLNRNLLNRVDGIMVFHTLAKDHSKKKLSTVTFKRTFRAVSINRMPGFVLNFSDKAVRLCHLAKTGYDPQYGARPLRRAIQNELEDFLADEYLEGHIKNNDKILLDIEKDKPVIQKERKKKKTE